MKSNKLKRRVSGIIVGILAVMLCFATPLTALAGTSGTATNPEPAILTKNLRFATGAGLSTPDATFTFNFAKVELDGSNDPADLAAMPAIGPVNLVFTSGEASTPVGGMEQVTKTENVLNFISTPWNRTGVYEYEVTETASGFTGTPGETMTYSQAKFTLEVVIAYDAVTNTYYPERTHTTQTVLDNGTSGGAKGDPGDTQDPTYNFIFENIYTKQGGNTPGQDALTITKTTTGIGSDASKLFSFTLTTDDSTAGILIPGTYTGTLTQGSTTTPVTITADGTPYSFTLASGDSLVIDDAPAGTEFQVEETGTASYIPSYTGTVGNNLPITGTAAVGVNLDTGTQKIGAIDNEVDYTNTFDSSLLPTGILDNIVPILALLAAAILSFIAFAALKHRKFSI